MIEDEIVLEIRKVKEALAARFNYDVRAIAEDARNRQKSSGHKIISVIPARLKKRAKTDKSR
jgi:hypothetical protein